MKKTPGLRIFILAAIVGLPAALWLSSRPPSGPPSEAAASAPPNEEAARAGKPGESIPVKDSPALAITNPEAVPANAAGIFSDIGNLPKGTEVSLPLPGGGTAKGMINYAKTHPNAATAAGGKLADGSGIFEIAREPWGYRGFILQKKDKIAYVYSGDTTTGPMVARRPIGEVICEPDPNFKPVAQADLPDPEKAAIYNDGRSVGIIYEPIPILHSLPRAQATIYLDFDGEVIEGQSWEGGARIVAPAYNLSAAEVTEMWRRVAEDYAPFEVNVTTDLQAYLRAPQGRRMRCITTTNNFASAGGVAFNNTFIESGDTVCWNFYSGNAGAVVISHEVGHTYNLAHDDTTTAGYYGGHGSGVTSWGPIMGAPYNQSVCQWSKGAYPNAMQFQDDLAYIGAMTPMKPDDHAATTPQATPLTLTSAGGVSNTGVIENPEDLDTFIFTTGGGSVSLQFTPAQGSPNLDIEAKLYNSSGTLLATGSPANNLSATISTTLAAGTYTVTVDGVGNATWTTGGYDDYGSIGAYSISGTVPQPGWRFRIPVNALAGAAVGTVAPGTGSGYSITAGNTGSAFAISANGVITVATPASLESNPTFSLTVSYTAGAVPVVATVPITVAPLRGLKQQIWTGLSGTSITNMTNLSSYPNSPNVTLYSPSTQASYNGNNYGQKISGYLLPQETGGYTFWTAADDSSELWLSTDSNPANKVRIAYHTTNVNPGAWTTNSTQQSAVINLVAGQRYYIEMLHRERTGGDFVAVAWQTPTQSRRLIPNENLEYPGTLANRAPWIANQTYRVRENSTTGTSIATLVSGDFEAGSVLSNYTITGGNTGSAFALNPTTGVLTVNGTLSFATTPKYFLNISATDSAGATGTAQIAVEVQPLAVKREVYNGITGNSVANLTSSPNYPNNPSSVSYELFFEAPVNAAENYGQRMSGYIRAPDSGSYTFWIASDDSSELWLSTDTNPANKARIAYVNGSTNSREWTRFTSQRSATITLEGGKFYYMEALMKEGVGGDNLAVSWQGPEFGQVILGAPHVTATLYNHAGPILDNKTVTVYNRDTVVTTLEAKDWSDPGTTVRYTITGGNSDGAFTIDPLTGVISRADGYLPVGTRVLTITATDNGPTPLSDTATVTVTVLKAGMKREVWRNLSTSQALAEFTNSLYFPHTPDVLGYTSDFRAPTSYGEQYGQRVSGYLIPPTTGNYQFWIASDDGGELWLSSDANPANKKRIGYVTGSVSELAWTSQTSQASPTIALTAGQPYYIEALMKEGTGGDHLAVAWQGPSISRAVIPSTYLEYPDDIRPAVKREEWYSTNSIAWAQVPGTGRMDWVNPVYTESFEGTGLLGGNATEAGGGTWSSSATWTRNNGVATKSTTGDAIALLPFTPQSGKVYNFSMEVDPTNSPGTTDWISLGFLNQPVGNAALYAGTNAFSTYGQAWMLARANGNSSGNTIQAFSSGTSDGIDSSAAVSAIGTYDTMAITLDTRGTNWVSSYYFNGALVGSHTLTGVPNIQSLGFSGIATARATVRNVRLSTNDSPATNTASFTGNLLSFKSPNDVAEGFSRCLSSFLVPQTGGSYTFWLASDDDGELWLSSDESPANAVRIASVTGYVAPEAWDINASQQSAPVTLSAHKRYYLEVRHRDGINGDHAAVAWQGPGITRQVIGNASLEYPSTPADRTLPSREVWTGISGNSVSDLTGNAAYPGSPSTTGTLDAAAGVVAPSDTADNFGERVSAFLVAPEDGRYTFWIASDDNSELWLSTDDHPTNRMRIATVNGASGNQAFDVQAGQKSVPVALAAGKRYYLEVLHKEGVGGDYLAVAWQGPSFDRQIIPNVFLEHPLVVPGNPGLKRELWKNVNGELVSTLTSSANYLAGKPDGRGILPTFETPTNLGDNYGQRITGRLVPPESGPYKFWIASDDGGELWLSTDEDPSHRAKIAECNVAAAPREWTKATSQESVTIMLKAGLRYHIEVLHKEGAIGDNLAVAWQGPSFARQVIDGRYLEYPGTIPSPVTLKREVWTNISGNNVSNLTSNGNYPNTPSRVETLNDFNTPYNEGDNYGQRVTGYLIAPFTGDYQFWIASDDGSDLNFSTTGVVADKTRIAYVSNASGVENWTSNATQASATIALTAGQRCYIEGIHKEGGGDDYMGVAWSGPGFSRQILRRQFLEYPGLPPGTAQAATIIPPPGIDTGYTFWLDYHNLAGNNRLANADSDGDGVPNSLEFIFGSDPASKDNAAALMPVFSTDPDWATFEYRRSGASRGIDAHAQFSQTLTSWFRASDVSGVQTDVVTDGYGAGVDKVIVRIPRAGVDLLFLRLNSSMR